MEKTIKYLENGEYHYATVRSVGDLAQLKTDSKETLVEAINELWNGGGNADPSKAPKPEGYDQLVEDVADAVKNQQEISQQWIEWQKEDAQLTEERKQAYLQAMKEMQESIDKAKADAAALDDKTAKLDEQITKTFSDLDTSIQNMHEQLQKEADRMNQELIDTKSDLTKVRTDLQNAQLDNGKIHDELTNINGKFEHKVWQTDLDPLKAQIDRAETSVQQTKDELLGKASREDLDTVTNTVSKLDTQLKETAKGVEISVKKDELGGEIAEALTNKTNILLGTRRFTTNNWTQRDHVEICSDPWKGFLVAKQNSPIEGIQQAYDVKAGTTYTFSLFAKMDNLDDSNKPQITLAQNNLDTSLDTKIDVWRKDIDDITSDFKRYDLTFTPSEDCTIYPHVISNSNNPIFVCGYQLEIGKELTPWEPNQEDVGDYVEKSEAQLNVYNDKIQALTEKQRQQGDTQEQLRTEVTQTAEGVKQVSESLKNTNGDITKLRGDLERTADHMKSEYESYTNKAVGQISDSTLNLIRNSSFQNKDEDFAQWQNISAKANIRQDENGLRWVELTQSGLTTDNPQGVTSNYFNIKQGKVTVAVDIKSGDKASLDNDSVLSLELYNDVKKRVDFYDVSLSQLGLSKELLGDHKVHRGLYRLGIDRNDAKYMTVKAKLVKNGDLYFTNFSTRLSSIDDGAYEPNPDDLNQQILKQNTKIEQNAKEVAIKANSVDVTRDIKSAVDGVQVGGVNLLLDTDLMTSEYWTAKSQPAYYRNRRALGKNNAALDTSISSWVSFNYKPKMIFDTSKEYTLSAYICSLQKGQSVTMWMNSDNTYKNSFQNMPLTNVSGDVEWQRLAVTFKPAKPEAYLSFSASNITTGQTVWVSSLMLEEGNKVSDYRRAPQDTSAEIKSAKDAAIQVASGQINLHVNELSTQFDDRLNKRINEQKTASEKFTSDGIKQVVTKITNVKGDVDRLGDTVNGIQIGGRNMVTGTENDIIIDDTSNTGSQGWCFVIIHLTQQPKLGDQITVSAEATLTGRGDLSSYSAVLFNSTTTNERSALANLIPGKRSNATLTINNLDGTGDTVLLLYAGKQSDTQGKKNIIHHLKVEFGNQATDWTPAPEDIDKKIDTQTLDSANIDEMKTQGHYFVRNLTGNPIGGWVYVDVTGNNNDRIRQDVYADQNNQHKYRSWNGSRWSNWEQGAYISDVNNVKTEVTASVKNLGDRVITQVNSVETRVNNKIDNLEVGGRNLLIGTSKDEKSGKAYAFADYQISGGLQPNKTYTLSGWARVDQDSLNHHQNVFIDAYSEDWSWSVSLGINASLDWQYNKITFTTPGGKQLHPYVTAYLSHPDGGTNQNNNDAVSGMAYIKKLKLEVGNKATDWSPAPEDVNNKIDGIQVGGRNILSNTENLVYKAKVTNSTNNPNSGDSMWKLAVGNLSDWLRNNPDVKEIAISYDYELQGATPTGTIRFGVNQAPAWEYMSGFNLQGKPAKGRVKLIVPVTDNMRETASNISRIRGDGLPIGATLIISHPKWEVGNKVTDWSPAPEDAVEAIKELNTKWDVANGQIQGKVTESQVNNILNGKGYATQAWAQSQFLMQKDRITLETVRSNITNGIQNQVNETRNKLDNLRIGGRNLLLDTNLMTTRYWQYAGQKAGYRDRRPLGENNICLKTSQSSWVSVNYKQKMIFDTSKTYTLSAYICSLRAGQTITMWLNPDSTYKNSFQSVPLTNNGDPDWQRLSATFRPQRSEVYISFGANNITTGQDIWISSLMIEEGTVMSDWAPAPEDIGATITLDSADINNMKTQGHYFVRNLTGNPVGGWVYVDVMGNNNDRLRQDVYQDGGENHKYRRWFGSYWTEWIDDVNSKNVISTINITPDQIKIASNKIVIDGNTDIHGDLRTDRVRLVGKNGAIDMTGDTGIKLTNNDGSSMLLERGNIDLMYKNDFRMNIDSSLMTIMQRNQFTNQNKPIAILNIGSSWNHSNNQIRGADIRYNPGNVNDVNLHGADYLALSYNKPNLTPGEANIKPQLVMAYQDLKFDENHYLWRKGVNVADDLTIQEYQRINVGYRDKEDQSGKWTNDPLMIHRMQWSNSYQADRYQPTIRLGYSKDSMGHAGVTFLWDQVKPFGDRDISDLGSIWFNGQRFVFGWASHKRMFGNQQQPAFMRLDDKGEIMSGIAFTPGSTWDLGSGAWNITASVMNNGG